MKLIFCLLPIDKCQGFLHIATIIYVCVARYNNKFAIFSQYLNIFRKKLVMKLIFCMQINLKACYKLILWFDGNSQASQSFQNSKFAILYNTSKKKLKLKLIFFMQVNIKVSYEFISTLLASKFSTWWYYHYQWAWTRILNLLNAISLQYL